LRAARDGAKIAIVAKTVEPHPKLPGTIYTAAEAVEAAGGRALALAVDIRDDAQIEQAVAETVGKFGGIDILVNNASAISLTGTTDTPMKRFDLMHQINARGTFAVSRACIPHLSTAETPHILTLAPPLNLNPAWFGPHLAYTMSKYGMSMCVLGLAEELRGVGVSANALWPRSVIATAALKLIPGIDPNSCSKPEIVADAAHALLAGGYDEATGATAADRRTTGQFLLDEDILGAIGVADFGTYAIDANLPLAQDLFLD
jgi:citronellol/citronellal dehydrogenase